ncbi:hypothetical protein Dda_8247 [Drechslerella dactyloides]|uniref:Uncharacterized protein n=1 Tax=Drechslerella dactyloides TaxID=74499 RepID=A0AAD6IRM7_DREDA|nr:hypothetical protein Dda_8247 [Drechslerella dactyloides]
MRPSAPLGTTLYPAGKKQRCDGFAPPKKPRQRQTTRKMTLSPSNAADKRRHNTFRSSADAGV